MRDSDRELIEAELNQVVGGYLSGSAQAQSFAHMLPAVLGWHVTYGWGAPLPFHPESSAMPK
jgi:hypothetical protein